ncbi:MAG TPA: hypothetical protein VFK70_19860 [Vicinamibacteria bacterium]|nr:hypothetical protein [Vicinamibacteria bacterium]
MALGLGLATSPDLPFHDRQPAVGGVVAGLTALFVIALLDRRAPRRLVAVGAATFALAVAYDSVRGEQGTMTLAQGQGTRTFDEEGAGGRPLGFHPLGDAVVLEAIEPDGTIVLGETDAQRRVRVSPWRAAAVAGYRLGPPQRVATGGARLVIRVSGGAEGDVSLREGEKGRAGDLDITLTQYFPDFALDERQQPFSRSDEPRNPAALLGVARGAASWRVFVIRAMPGIHHPEGLDRTLELVDVVADEGVRFSVHREPAALLAGLGLLVAAIGVAWSRW